MAARSAAPVVALRSCDECGAPAVKLIKVAVDPAAPEPRVIVVPLCAACYEGGAWADVDRLLMLAGFAPLMLIAALEPKPWHDLRKGGGA